MVGPTVKIWRVCSVDCETLAYEFSDGVLFETALTHPTYANENRGVADNQRLEFLGDNVVNLSVTRMLYRQFPELREGELTKLRAELINEKGLARMARHLGLGQWLRLGRGEEQGGGRDKDSILADAYEALMGAVFLDGGFEAAASLVEQHFAAALGSLAAVSSTDYKSALIEHCQLSFKCPPEIRIIDEYGPEHAKVFVAEVLLEGRQLGRGEGRSKKQASQEACRESFKSLGLAI